MKITRTATLVATDRDGNVLDAVLMRWGDVATVSDDGRSTYTEEWEPGSLVVGDPGFVPVYRGHIITKDGPARGPLIGRVAPADTDGAFAGSVELADTNDAREVHSLASLVGATVSIEADVAGPSEPGTHVVRTAAEPSTLTGVAVILAPDRGAYPAAVAVARTEPVPNIGDPAMTDTDTTDTPTLAPADIAGQIDEAVRIAVSRVRLPSAAEQAHPLAAFRTFVDYADAAYNDHAIAALTIGRALVDQITPNNPGVIPPAWLQEVQGIIALGRPLISNIGTTPLGPSGMEVDWPYYDGDLALLVLEQAAQKTEITSVRVDLKKGSAPLKTYAGGSDISYQLIRRSSPAYHDAYLRIMASAYTLRTDYAASAAISTVAHSTAANHVVYDPAAADPTGAVLRAAVFAASVEVEAATGAPASVILAATDMYVKLGGSLQPNNNAVQNVVGTATASTLNANVSGLALVHARYLPAGTIIVTNNIAASWTETGPETIAAVDVAKLGENVAVWGMGAAMVFNPKGLVLLSPTAPVVEDAPSARGKKSDAND